MAQFSQVIRVLHLASAFIMLAGLIGRQFARIQVARATDMQRFHSFIRVSDYFESWLVIPGSLLVLVFGLLLAWLQGWPVLGFLQGAAANWLLFSTLLYLSLYLLVIFVFIPRGKVFGEAMEKALAQGQITTELSAALHDPAVRAAHLLEGIVVAVIVYLMVMKPF
jgi:uncharacterized membrane protein